jgi:hypothetical protein
MLKRDAVKFYGSEAQLAKALRIHRSAVFRWSRWVPLVRAVQLEQLTAGRLKCDPNAYVERK